jgi:hypothetical protein
MPAHSVVERIFRLSDAPRRGGRKEFAERFPNMPEERRTGPIVAVPPPTVVGVSLWGSADRHDMTILFECDLRNKIVDAFNLTT